jgi:hypothetical protein
MPSPPTPFDDEADRTFDTSTDVSTRTSTHDDGRQTPASNREPKFWVRRLVVIGGVVAVFATAALVVGSLVTSTSNETASGAVTADWNRVVIVDERTGRVTIDNESGEEVGRVDTGTRSVVDVGIVDASALVVSESEVAIVDLPGETSTTVALDAAAISLPTGSALTLIAAPPGARGLMVHGPSGDVIDTDDVAPIAGTRYEWASALGVPSGRDVLVTDSGNFQSVLLSFDRDEPSYFPGLALAINDEVVVTAQNVGTDAKVDVFDHDREPISSGSSPSVRAALIGDGTIQLVTVDGELVSMSTDSGDTESTGRLDIGAVRFGVVTTGGDRLIVSGADGSAIVDAEGAVVGTYPGLQPTPGTDEVAGSTCVVLSDGSGVDGGGRVAIVDIADGSILNEVDVTAPLSSSADGCTLASAVDDGFQIASSDAVSTVRTDGEFVGLSPDGALVVMELDRRLVLADAASGADDDSIDLGPTGRQVGFTQL